MGLIACALSGIVGCKSRANDESRESDDTPGDVRAIDMKKATLRKLGPGSALELTPSLRLVQGGLSTGVGYAPILRFRINPSPEASDWDYVLSLRVGDIARMGNFLIQLPSIDLAYQDVLVLESAPKTVRYRPGKPLVVDIATAARMPNGARLTGFRGVFDTFFVTIEDGGRLSLQTCAIGSGFRVGDHLAMCDKAVGPGVEISVFGGGRVRPVSFNEPTEMLVVDTLKATDGSEWQIDAFGSKSNTFMVKANGRTGKVSVPDHSERQVEAGARYSIRVKSDAPEMFEMFKDANEPKEPPSKPDSRKLTVTISKLELGP